MPVRPEVLDGFRRQVAYCDDLGSPFTARLLGAAVAELERGGPLCGLLCDWPGDPTADALALRFAGACHALARSGDAPALAALYPPHPGALDLLWAAVRAEVEARGPWFREFLRSPPQTNEVRRAAVLLGGFLTVAAETGLPLRLLEIGASAGLLQVWDSCRYRLGSAAWGDADSQVEIATDWTGPLPPLGTPLSVASRAGCDLRPVDIGDPAARARLAAYVWADQRERAALLDAAIGLALARRVRVEAADAADWVERQLATRAPGQATVLYHSIVWQYLPADTQGRIQAALERAGRDASADAPLAWLAFELGEDATAQLTMTTWPGGTRLLAEAHPHGAWVRWMG